MHSRKTGIHLRTLQILRGAKSGAMSSSFSKCAQLSLILLSLLLPCLAAASGNTIHVKTFNQAANELQRLINNSNSSIKELNDLAEEFLKFRNREKGFNRALCLFFAGKSYLNLYKRSHDSRHLNKSIEYLTHYKKTSQNSKYYKEALFELKEAYLFKRKNRTSLNTKITSAGAKRKTTASSDNKVVESGPLQGDIANTTLIDDRNQESDFQPSSRVLSRDNNRAPINRAGNPFFYPDEFEFIAQPGDSKIRSASIPPPSITDAKPEPKHPVAVPQRNRPVVVIDPGHGGKDPGAVSDDLKIAEKDVTLELSKLLKRNLEKLSPNVSVFLTRNDDIFLTLKERAKIANNHGADVFISVHFNDSDFESASGPEIFYLSKSSSRGAMRAAARENGVSLSKMTDIEATLIDLLMTSKNSESNKLAQVVHSSLVASDAKTGLKFRDRGVKQAPFYVLIGATMPAILVECGFVNNLSQQSQKARENFIKSVAVKLASGTLDYLKKLPTNSD